MDLPELILYAIGMGFIGLMIVACHLLFPETPEEKESLCRVRDEEMRLLVRVQREELECARRASRAQRARLARVAGLRIEQRTPQRLERTPAPLRPRVPRRRRP